MKFQKITDLLISTETAATSIRAKLEDLSEVGLQRHYYREATYLLQSWPGFTQPVQELAAWAMAKDFAILFPRHSYLEWAYVFGIPRSHVLLGVQVHPARIARSRNEYLVRRNCAIFEFVMGCVIGYGILCVIKDILVYLTV